MPPLRPRPWCKPLAYLAGFAGLAWTLAAHAAGVMGRPWPGGETLPAAAGVVAVGVCATLGDGFVLEGLFGAALYWGLAWTITLIPVPEYAHRHPASAPSSAVPAPEAKRQ